MKMILFFGAPGVGKGTQAKIVSKNLNIPHISTGDILRSAIKQKSELGLKAQTIVENGGLVPDDIMISLVEDVLKSEECKDGFILDGFPRTLDQAKLLHPIINDLSTDKLIVVSLDAVDEVIIDRLTQRRMCKVCQNTINLNLLADTNVCPSCGSVNSFIKRKDDDAEVIKNRLNIFHKTTKPVLDFYQDKSVIHRIDGTQSVEEITNNILEVLS